MISTTNGQRLYVEAKTLIPGGTQLLSKRPEMFLPEHWPAYYQSASGCSIRDIDGNTFLDFSYMGIGACPLGYADPDVSDAVIRCIRDGSMTTLNAPEEVELAHTMLDLHPWAQMVRYARTGGEAMSMAARIARASTRRNKILFCGYHGWHDWYLAANLSELKALDGHLLPGLDPCGVPRELVGTSFPFHYNNIHEFHELLHQHGDDTAAVVMEPIRNHEPEPGFFAEIRDTCSKRRIALIMDEITAGFRLNLGGAHLKLGIEPDIAVFAKAIGNGTPMAVILGRSSFMEAAQDSFISSTYWTERTGPVAALATIGKMARVNLPDHMDRIGRKIMSGWKSASERFGVPVAIGGIPPLAHFSFELGTDALVAKTLFTQEMLRRGFLATTACYVSLAHTDALVDRYLDACMDVFLILSSGIQNGDMKERLEGPVCHGGFQRLA